MKETTKKKLDYSINLLRKREALRVKLELHKQMPHDKKELKRLKKRDPGTNERPDLRHAGEDGGNVPPKL